MPRMKKDSMEIWRAARRRLSDAVSEEDCKKLKELANVIGSNYPHRTSSVLSFLTMIGNNDVAICNLLDSATKPLFVFGFDDSLKDTDLKNFACVLR